MANLSVNLQDSFLNQVRKENSAIEVVLLTGSSFQGVVKGFDNFTVVFHVEGKQHLVYKHAIAQLIAPKMARLPSNEQHPDRPERQASARKKPVDQPPAVTPQKFNAIDLSGVRKELEGTPSDTGGRTGGRSNGKKPSATGDASAILEAQEKAVVGKDVSTPSTEPTGDSGGADAADEGKNGK